MPAPPPPARHAEETVGEQIANAATHGLGAVLSGVGLAVLVVLASLGGSALAVVALTIYGVSLVLLYSASTIYHSVRGPRARAIFQLLDHLAIFVLIAGTYTPFTLLAIGGAKGWGLFGMIWALAAAGIVLRLVFRRRALRIAIPLYLAMGWLGVIALSDLMASTAFAWLLAGGVAYTAGIAFYAWHRLPFNHAVWHLFVLAGSGCHFTAVALIAMSITA